MHVDITLKTVSLSTTALETPLIELTKLGIKSPFRRPGYLDFKFLGIFWDHGFHKKIHLIHH